MIALLLIVGTTAVVNDLVARDAVRQLVDRDGRIAEIALRSIGEMFKARRQEKDFLLSHKEFGLDEARTRYVGPFRVQLAELRSQLSEIRSLTSDGELVGVVGRVEEAVVRYEKGKIIGQLKPTGIRPRFIDRFEENNIYLPPNIFGFSAMDRF